MKSVVTGLVEQIYLQKGMFHVTRPSCRIVSILRGKSEKGRYIFKLDIIMQVVHSCRVEYESRQ